MPEGDSGERTEQPTARRLQEAREQGRIARSTDLTAAIGLLGGLVLLNVFGAELLDTLLGSVYELGEPVALSSDRMLETALAVVRRTGMVMLPYFGALLLITAIGALIQSGAVVTWNKLLPKLSHLSPLKGLQRLFSTDALTRLGMGLLKMLCVGAVAYYTVSGMIEIVLGTATLPVRAVFSIAAHVLFTVGLRMALILLILGIIDYLYQRWSMAEGLKMTKQEVKDELKSMEGDPAMKARRRQVQAKLALQRIRMDVPRADVVVTNPTEYAVALRYDESTMAAPRVIAKGKDFLALQIRQVAQQHGVPIVQRPPLARALYATVEVGGEVPPAYYRAVAEILAYVYQLSGKAVAN